MNKSISEEDFKKNEIEEKDETTETEISTDISKYEFSSTRINWSLGYLVEQIDRKIRLDPDFQRLPTAWSENRKQNLILSFHNNIPVPPIYLFEISPGTYNVIDGLQRICTIKDFIKKKLIVKVSTGIKKETRDFTDDEFRSLEDKELSIIIMKQISPNNSNAGQYEIFKILNQSSVVLSKQEMRNCVFRGEFNDFVKNNLNNLPDWRLLFKEDVKIARYSDIEMIYRCLIITFYMEKFSGSMSKTIEGFMETYNKNFNSRVKEIKEFEDVFIKSCKFAIDNKINDKLNCNRTVRFESIFGAIMKAIKEKTSPKADIIKIFKEFIDPAKDTEFARLNGAGGTGGEKSIESRVGYVYKTIFDVK